MKKRIEVIILDVGKDMPLFLKGLAEGLKQSDSEKKVSKN